MKDVLDSPIEFLKGVGPQRGELLNKELRIFTFRDLLHYFPFRYIDKSEINTVRQIPEMDGYVQLKGTIRNIKKSGIGRNKRLSAIFADETGSIELTWFAGINYVEGNLHPNRPVLVYGKPKYYGAAWNIPHPEMEYVVDNPTLSKQLIPVYPSTEKASAKGLHAKGIAKIVENLLEQIQGYVFPEVFPQKLLQENQLLSRNDAIRQIHYPKNHDWAQAARRRLKYEELFFLQMELILRKQIGKAKIKSFVFNNVGDVFLDFYENHLPFELTGAQKRVVKEIRADFFTGSQMNRLLQGDVGSGKTMVALLTMLIAVGNGYQATLMAPTEILAQQHFQSLTEVLQKTDIQIRLLTGSTKTAERREIHAGLEDGTVHILIGTHAIIEPKVKFLNLGFAVIDEQHRFGVAQRSKLYKKNTMPPHILVMTATPIPRTLALSFYGDLDVSVIDELPPGRKPIKTVHYRESQRLRVFGFIKEQIELGRQIYFVYPLIKESETLDYQNLMQGYESIVRQFPLPEYRVAIVHGQMKPEDKDFEMARFVKGEAQIMVATTVIEVGVNVPNASVMIIESSERFGLAQMHQLRGRVGRGAEQSFCILMTGDKLSAEGKKRLQTMCETNDGFVIAEVDLEIRGPGDIMGTQQSGLIDLKIADLARDGGILTEARNQALALLENDPNLEQEMHHGIREEMRRIMKSKPDWSRVG
jgi:ATP-dependent DNA helicase RecG